MKLLDLLEALSLSQVRPYRKAWNPERYAALFQSMNGWDGWRLSRNGFRMFKEIPPFDNPRPVKSDTQPMVWNHLMQKGVTEMDYLQGLAKGKDGRTYRIGRLLKDEPILAALFASDPARKMSKKEGTGRYVVISRHPYDVAGMSTNRGWRSCMHIEDGTHKRYVIHDVKEGTLVSYEVGKNDLNIQNPSGRRLIKVYTSVEENDDYMLIPASRVYGQTSPNFSDPIREWCNRANEILGGSSEFFCLTTNTYDDGDDQTRSPDRVTMDNLHRVNDYSVLNNYLNVIGTGVRIDQALPYIQSGVASPALAYIYASTNWNEIENTPLQMKIENIIKTDAKFSYLYANRVRCPFPEGEDAISTDPSIAINYVLGVIEKPYPKLEDSIARKPEPARVYAEIILKGPFKKGEKAIATSPEESFFYAKNVIQGPFPEGEEAISTSARFSYRYAKDVIKGPFKKGEKSMSSVQAAWEAYQNFIQGKYQEKGSSNE